MSYIHTYRTDIHTYIHLNSRKYICICIDIYIKGSSAGAPPQPLFGLPPPLPLAVRPSPRSVKAPRRAAHTHLNTWILLVKRMFLAALFGSSRHRSVQLQWIREALHSSQSSGTSLPEETQIYPRVMALKPVQQGDTRKLVDESENTAANGTVTEVTDLRKSGASNVLHPYKIY